MNRFNLKPPTTTYLFIISMLLALLLTLACSAGSLVVQVATPTPTRFKTPRPTYTFTPVRLPTSTPSPTPTETSTPTVTPSPPPTPTQPPEGAAAPAQPAAQVEAPPEPTATPTPAEPTPSPTPEYPFQVNYFVHDTGSPGETRMTAWIRQDSGPGLFKTLSGFQVKAIAPDGNTYLSELSGSGPGDSTVKGTGDNHNMNTKLEFRPYTPGDYTIYLVEGGVQVSPEIKLTLSADPLQYTHFDFFKQKEEN
jgi:hypothetical protein